ncbi:MAG: ABC transporter permease [Bdellovibrionales bacterium]|nr:ABC transporter permease [Bdellovibrionales bacterium]
MSKYKGLRYSFSDFKRQPWLHIVSISTITIALVIIGGFFLCYRNFEKLAEKTSPQITGTAYLKEALTTPQIQALRERILSLENVQRVSFKSKDNVVEELQSFLGSAGSISLPGSELFPDIIEMEVKKETSPEKIQIIKGIVTRFPEVAEVDFSDDWLSQYKKISQIIKLVGLIIMGFVIVGCSFLIANFMGMRHQSRRNEIEIVNLIGADRNFILAPYIWEGIIEGISGATVALALLLFIKLFLSSLISGHWSTFLGVHTWSYLSVTQVMAVYVIGVTMALLGGVTVFLRFQEDTF